MSMPAPKRVLVAGLDPGTGASSPTGLALFDPETREIIALQNVAPPDALKKFSHRVRYISEEVEEVLLSVNPYDVQLYTYCESFVMRGKGGEMLARLTGALMSIVPWHSEFDTVANTTVKKLVAGHGRADKVEVAQAVLTYFASNAASAALVQGAMKRAEWDKLDALAIGICGYKREQHEG